MSVDLAGAEDGAGIARLLEQPLDGDVRLVLHDGAPMGMPTPGALRRDVVVARGPGGMVLGMGSRSVRPAWCDGEPCLIGWLGQLRRDPAVAGRVRLLRQGFSLMQEQRRADELPFDLTSIVAGSPIARAILAPVEAGRAASDPPPRRPRGLPRYIALTDFTTLVMQVPRREARLPSSVVRGRRSDLPRLVDCLRRNLRRYQFAPRYDHDLLSNRSFSAGLGMDDLSLVLHRGPSGVRACAAVWDLRTTRRVAIAGYSPRLRRWRPWLNVALALQGSPRLPAPPANPSGAIDLSLAFLSHVAVDGDDPRTFRLLLEGALRRAQERSVSLLVAGFADGHPFLDAARRAAGCWCLRSTLYMVMPAGFAERAGSSPAGGMGVARPVHVEVATL